MKIENKQLYLTPEEFKNLEKKFIKIKWVNQQSLYLSHYFAKEEGEWVIDLEHLFVSITNA